MKMQTSSANPKTLTIRPHAGQLATLKADQDFVAAIAGTGGGKTVGGEAWVLKNLALYPGEMGLVVEPTWDMVHRILMTSSPRRPSLLKVIQHLDSGAFYSRGDRTIYSRLGTIFLGSATHPESMEGAHVKWAWLDEAGQMSALAFETAARRVAFKAGQVLLTTTPYNRGWLYREFYQRFIQGDPHYFITRYNSLANPAYPRRVYERNRVTMSRARFSMMHEGGFERAEGMVYGDQWKDDFIVDPFPIPNTWWQGAAIDFGYNHPTGAAWGARDDDGNYYLVQDYRKPSLLIHQHAQNLLSMSTNNVHPSLWYADPAAKQARADLASNGIITSAANNDVATGIDTVGKLMAQGQFKVFRTCTAFLDEVESYVWSKVNDLWTDKPVKLNDDVMDAVRYLFHTTETRTPLRIYT